MKTIIVKRPGGKAGDQVEIALREIVCPFGSIKMVVDEIHVTVFRDQVNGILELTGLARY